MKDYKTHIDKALSGLKDFQLETVEHVIRQFFKAGKKKILIADEVGLGKTIVSRGVLAKMYENHLATKGANKTFTTIYICSNQAIARQNLSKLNFLSGKDAEDIVEASAGDDRLTALAYAPKPKKTDKFKVRIKAFTPATSFDQNTRAGRSDERVLLFRLLFEHPLLSGNRNSLKWILKGDGRMKNENWFKVIKDALLFERGEPQQYRHLGPYRAIRPDIKEEFYNKLSSEILPSEKFGSIYKLIGKDEDDTIMNVLAELCRLGVRKNNYRKNAAIFRSMISHLRLQLSECCKNYLKADLFILDEFQRYSKLLSISETESPGIELARQVLNSNSARVLLLSATPFKPYTNDFDRLNGESHFEEFDKILRFLLQGEDEQLWKHLKSKRSEFFDYLRHPDKIKESNGELLDIKKSIEDTYFSVMARTERMLVSQNKDAMVKPLVKVMEIRKEDIQDFVAFDKIVHHLNTAHSCRLPVPIEYAKSSPYPLSFLANYTHKKQLEKLYPESETLRDIVNRTKESWMDIGLISKYKPLFGNGKKNIPNPKIRLLLDETMGDNGWKYLWIPPSLNYYEPQSVYRDAAGFTKSLIFSSWKMVPRMIASVISYEAERNSIQSYQSRGSDKEPEYFAKPRYPSSILNFKMDRDGVSPASMNNFMLNYPSIYLAGLYDPQVNIRDKKTIAQIKTELREQIKKRLIELGVFEIGNDDGDWQKWSWYSVLLLDKNHPEKEELKSWLLNSNISDDIATDDENGTDKENSKIKDLHFEEVRKVILEDYLPNISRISDSQLDDVCDFLADLCLGSPATNAMRSFQRLFDSNPFYPSYLVAAGCISLFDKPESIATVQSCVKGKSYYRKVLKYGIEGNIQAMLDEYFYLLKDSNSIKDANELANVVSSILAIRPSSLEIGTIENLKNKEEKVRMRTHYALDFGEEKLSTAKANRQINIREAFNSPFRPFVLASTAIGQEGLDFHFYSKKIVHWNLPGNPIDFEQREGRIHRYKGHVIRLSVVEKYGSELDKYDINDGIIWDQLFEIASKKEKKKYDFQCDMIPCWHIEPSSSGNNTFIDRIVPLYPFSKDIDKYHSMLKILAYYRFTFGQPRQEELIHVLADKIDGSLLDDLMIQLSPIKKLQSKNE